MKISNTSNFELQGGKSQSAQKAEFKVQARVSPGLFRLSIGGKTFHARSILDLKSGQVYSGKISENSNSLRLLLHSRTPGVLELLSEYRSRSGVEDTALSRMLLSMYNGLQRTFDPAEFKTVYLQLSWVVETLREELKNSELKPHIIARYLIILKEKGLPVTDKLLADFFSELSKYYRTSAHNNSSSESDPGDNSDGNGRKQLFELFNMTRNRESNSGSWIHLPLVFDNDSKRRCLLNFNPEDPSSPISCTLEGWSFFWYRDATSMFAVAPESVYTARGENGGSVTELKQKGRLKVLEGELRNFLKAATFEKVEIYKGSSVFDGFSPFFDSNTLDLHYVSE